MKAIPSTRVSLCFFPTNITRKRINVAAVVNSTSMLELVLNSRGVMVEVSPSIQNTLKMLDPMALPMAKSV